MNEKTYREIIYYIPDSVNPESGDYEFCTQFGRYFTQLSAKSIKYGCETMERLIDEMIDLINEKGEDANPMENGMYVIPYSPYKGKVFIDDRED